MAKTSGTTSKTATGKKSTKGKKADKIKSDFKVTKNKNKKTNNSTASNIKKGQNRETPPAPKKGAAKGFTTRRTDANGQLAIRKGDSDDEDFDRPFDIYPDDPNDSDYVDDSDAEIIDSVAENKCDYGDLTEEGGRYAVLLKSGAYEDEQEHEEKDPSHQTCVLDAKDEHTCKQL